MNASCWSKRGQVFEGNDTDAFAAGAMTTFNVDGVDYFKV